MKSTRKLSKVKSLTIRMAAWHVMTPVLFILTLGLAVPSVEADTLDIVFANFLNQRNRVCLGDGAGGFTCSDISADTNNTRDVALGDVDGNGDLDVVFNNSSQRNRVCLGDGAGGFTCSDVSTDIRDGGEVALGFMDGDLNLDIVFANGLSSSQHNQVCLGDGMGGFTCSDVDVSTIHTGVALGFINGDANLDAVFTTAPTGGAPDRVCLGNGAGGFSSCSNVNNATTADVALGDMNDDGNLDAVFANTLSNNSVCLGDGAGGFTCSVVSTGSSFSQGVDLGFVDGDANLDAIFSNRDGPDRVCLGNGAGGFSSCSDVSADTTRTEKVALGFVDGDSNLDAIFSKCCSPGPVDENQVCLGDGAGNFTCSDVSADLNFSLGVALGDFDPQPGCCIFAKNDCEFILEAVRDQDGGKFTKENLQCSEIPGICNVVITPIPTLNQWGLIAMAGLLGLFSLFIIIRRHRYNLS